jgi:putative intracellular protease/amidase
MECEAKIYDKPGACPVCGMDLVKISEKKRSDKQVAILIFNGVQIIDYSAPWEVFGQAHFRVFSVAEKSEAITTSMGMSVNPQYTFENSPKPDILMIPGGEISSAQNSQKTIQWIKKTAGDAEYVLSVCNGAFLLAKAGLLDGLTATTFYALIPSLKQEAPKTKVVSDQRFVDNGKIITTAGLTSGIDGALHVVSKILGKGPTQAIALHLEYNWQPQNNWARAALADRKFFSSINAPDTYNVKIAQTGGTREEWTVVLNVETPEGTTAADVERELTTRIKAIGKKVSSHGDTTTSTWTVNDEQNANWSGKTEVRLLSKQPKLYEVKLGVKKKGTV